MILVLDYSWKEANGIYELSIVPKEWIDREILLAEEKLERDSSDLRGYRRLGFMVDEVIGFATVNLNAVKRLSLSSGP